MRYITRIELKEICREYYNAQVPIIVPILGIQEDRIPWDRISVEKENHINMWLELEMLKMEQALKAIDVFLIDSLRFE